MAAAYLDYRDTVELARGVARGQAPAPIGYQGAGHTRQPIWSKVTIDAFTTPRTSVNVDRAEKEDLASLV